MGLEIPLDVDYFEHPKIVKLVTILGPDADIFPLRLWFWAAKYARNGVLTDRNAVETVAKWRGKRGKLLNALFRCKLLKRGPKRGQVSIHDWMQGIGRSMLMYENKKRKQREKRLKDAGIVPEDDGHAFRKSDGSIERPERPVQDGTSYPEDGVDGLYRASPFKAPGAITQKREFQELLRLGVDSGRIMTCLKSVEAQTMEFYEWKKWALKTKTGSAIGINMAEVIRKAKEIEDASA